MPWAVSLSQPLRSSERPNCLCHSLSAAPEDFLRPFGTAFYDLKTPQEKIQRAIRQGLEGLCMEAVAGIERVHPTTVQQWVDRVCLQAKAADQEVITGVSTENVELDELHTFAGARRPDAQESVLDEVGRHWKHCAMARESRLLLEVVVWLRTQESATKLVEGASLCSSRLIAAHCGQAMDGSHSCSR